MSLHPLTKASQVGNNQQRSANVRKRGQHREPAKKVGSECFERLAKKNLAKVDKADKALV
jgi:hypothetical protein